jgi:anion-transporting  ArsA/GET3 family ATPase
MTITFENESDVIVYALESIISFARENQYLFVSNCAWWIAGIIGLDTGLTIFIDNLESRKRIGQHREISTKPRDIARSVSADPDLNKLEESLIASDRVRNPRYNLRTIRTNRIQKLSKTQRKKLRRAARAQMKS